MDLLPAGSARLQWVALPFLPPGSLLEGTPHQPHLPPEPPSFPYRPEKLWLKQTRHILCNSSSPEAISEPLQCASVS